VTGLPRNHLSLTATEEFRHRFGTDNNRVALQFDWRQSTEFTLTLLGALGAPATVVPRATAGLRAALQIWGPFDGAVAYTFDALPVPVAELSRVRVESGIRYLKVLRSEASYTFGYYTQQGTSDTTNAVLFRTCWEPRAHRFCAFYGYGAEIYGLVVLDPLNPPGRINAHTVGADALVSTWSWLDVRIAADVEFRNNAQGTNATRIYRGTLGGRFWF
jgi:hypothetical protein